MGGCLLNDTLDWGGYFFTCGSLPPDPEIVGHNRWKEMWKHRLDNLECYPMLWMEHQRRDAFWKHGSVCEDYSSDRNSGAECQRLGRWLYGGGLPLCREPSRRQGHRRTLGPQISPCRHPGTGHRLPAGMPALVRPLAEGQEKRGGERSAAAALSPGRRKAEAPFRPAPGPLDRPARMAVPKYQDRAAFHLGDGTLEPEAQPRQAAVDHVEPVDGPHFRRMVRLWPGQDRTGTGHRPARGRCPVALFRWRRC